MTRHTLQSLLLLALILASLLIILLLTLLLILLLNLCLGLILIDLYHILIAERMRKPHLLWHELTAASPHLSKLELLRQVAMDLLADTLDGAAVTVVGQDDWVSEIGCLLGFFGVDAH
jgi:hypothetical protein